MALVKVSNDIMEIKLDYKAKGLIVTSDIPEVLDAVSNKVRCSWIKTSLIKLTDTLVIQKDNDENLEKDAHALIDDKDILIRGLRAKLKQFEWKSVDVKPTESDCDAGCKLLGSSTGHGYVHEMTLTDVLDRNFDITHWMAMPKPPKGCVR